MNTNVRVAFDGEAKTCLEVYHRLYTRQEEFSEHCINTQGELFGQCCEAFPNHVDTTILADAAAEDSPSSPPQDPEPEFEATWYAGALNQSSPAVKSVLALWSLYPLIAIILV